MYFLIDHENVSNNGYKGSEYLLSEDTVEIFFSNNSKNIMTGLFGDMERAGCNIKICKLYQTRKNALDFYITSRLGELIGKCVEGNIAIISGDQGFKSVQEYWMKVAFEKKKIGLFPTIADAIACSGEGSSRTSILRERLKTVSIENEYTKYQEKNKIHRILEEKFKDTELFEKVEQIEKIFENHSSKKMLYLDSLKMFGKKEGLIVYHCIKDLVGLVYS